MCACHNAPWQADHIYVLLLGQSGKHTSRSQTKMTPGSSRVSDNQSETATDMCETTLDEMSPNQAAAGPPQTNQTPMDNAVTNTTPNQFSTNETQANEFPVDQSLLPTNQTTTRPSQINQPSENTTVDQLLTNQGNLQTSQSATKGIIKYSSAS